MKLFIFSIDDGTIYDQKVLQIFDKYKINATFNLNSGLENFVWYLDDLPINRLNLKDNKDLYKNHEIASHSLTHPHLTMCPGEVIVKEVGEDITILGHRTRILGCSTAEMKVSSGGQLVIKKY